MINRITNLDAPGNGRTRTIPPAPVGGPPTFGDFGARLEKYIGDHPVMSLAIGLTVGIVIGCLIKRR